jgi:hypothetical protein
MRKRGASFSRSRSIPWISGVANVVPVWRAHADVVDLAAGFAASPLDDSRLGVYDMVR